MIELTQRDREAIDKCYADNGWDISDQLSEYHLCEAIYRAGIAAGIERAAKHMESESTNTAIKIRALLK